MATDVLSLTMAAKGYLIDIKDYQFDLNSEKVNSIARLVKLKIPTVPLPHVLLPKSFGFYRQHGQLPTEALKELRIVFDKLQQAGYPATVRPSIFADIPGAEFIVANQVNLPSLKQTEEAIIAGYKKIIKEFGRSEKIEFAYLLQGFYTANKAGVVYSEDGDGNVHISAAFGEHTWVITRAEVQTDVYKIDKQTDQIKEKKIATKEFSLEPSESGLKRVKLRGNERTKSVFTEEEVEEIYQYALKMEKEHGPQEIECAVLRSGELIFQSARDSRVKKIDAVAIKNVPIFLQAVGGEMVQLDQLKKDLSLSDKIVVTDNLDIDFITRLVYRFKPKAVVLTRGSLTAHAVTILREAKIPSILAVGLKTDDHRFCRIKKNGEVNCYS